jgi:FAD/FMN-containing dehydrogenase
VAKVTFEKNLTPPVMPDAMMLTVGGTLSVGGIGETSYRYGAQVDNVVELDVVTGAGELVTCSPERNSDSSARCWQESDSAGSSYARGFAWLPRPSSSPFIH